MTHSWPLAVLLLLGQHNLQAAMPEGISASGDSSSQQVQQEWGKRIYLDGVLPDGSTISAKVRGDVTLQGSQYACATCHRRSGIGSSEGGDQVPAITGEVLFSPHIVSLHDTYSTDGMRTVTRPAYTTETLKRVLREGVDSSGRKLSPLMPRFALTDGEVVALSAYLAGLNITMPPGIDEQEMHFATITTPGNESAREAMLNVLSTFFRIKNAGIRNEVRRAQNAPYHKEWEYQAYRRWRLHEWELKGPETEWPAQLQAYYRKQPVFAVLSGVGRGNWQAVHRFCEAQQLPCLMPHIPLPPSQADEDFYSLYFSRGVELEALTLAKHLREITQGPRHVIQISDQTVASKAAAQILRQALTEQSAITLEEIAFKPDQIPGSEFWKELAEKHGKALWVVWLDRKKLKGLDGLSDSLSPDVLYLSASLQGDISTLQGHPLQSHLILLTPYRAADMEKHTLRFRTWARLRQLPSSELHIQSASFLAATLVGETLMHMRGNLSREYFLELMEHNIDNMINPSLYPRISLAPGQRFTVKGCYVWEMAREFDTAQWIVP